MANFDELKAKTGEAVEIIAGKAALAAKYAAEKTSALVKIAALNSDILAEKERLRVNYSKLGKLYYDKFHDDADNDLLILVERISASKNAIVEAREKIEALKSSDSEGGVEDAEIEAVDDDAEDESDNLD